MKQSRRYWLVGILVTLTWISFVFVEGCNKAKSVEQGKTGRMLRIAQDVVIDEVIWEVRHEHEQTRELIKQLLEKE